MRDVWMEIRLAGRALVRNGGISAAAIATLALGIGACTAVFSVVYGVLLRPLPYPEPDRVMQVWQVYKGRGNHMQTSDPNFEEIHDQNRSFEDLAQFNHGVTTVLGGREPVRMRIATVSREFFQALGVQPAIGRTFTEEELQLGASPAALVSYGFWRRFLEEDADLSRRKLRFSNRIHSVVGVMPAGFSFPADAEIWIPREIFPVNPSRTAHNWLMIGRLKADATVEQAQKEMKALARRHVQEHGEETWLGDIDVVPLREELVGNVRPRLLILLGAVGFLLLVACFNVSNLLLTRFASQRSELAVRSALGAGRWRLGRKFLTESLLTTLCGGLLGVLASAGGVRLLMSLEPGNLPRADGVSVNWTAVAFALGLSVLTALALGMLPILYSGEGRLLESLNEGGRARLGSPRLRSLLVAAQVSLTLVLLVGAGLFARSFLRLAEVDPGFSTENRVVFDLAQPYPSDDDGRARLAAFHEELMRRLKGIAGVDEVGGISGFPLSGRYANGQFMVDNSEEDLGYAEYRVASEGYFPAMGIPLLQGRLPGAGDGPESPHVAVISKALADKKWPGEDPLGKRIQFGNMDGDQHLLHVVGIVGDVLDYGLDREQRGTVYLYYRQRPHRTGDFSIVLSGGRDSAQIASESRRILQSMNPELPVRFRTLAEIFSSSMADRRFSLLLLSVFGAAALTVAAIGIFGAIAYAVSLRTREIGVRMALGARQTDVFRMVLRQGLIWAASGMALGLAAALALSRILSGMLYEISPSDPASYLAAGLVLVLTTLAACQLPARRAARLDPLKALRYE